MTLFYFEMLRDLDMLLELSYCEYYDYRLLSRSYSLRGFFLVDLTDFELLLILSLFVSLKLILL